MPVSSAVKPVTQSADELIQSWAAFLPGFDSIHLMVTNHTMTRTGPDTGTAKADFTATHQIDDAIGVLGGRYHYQLGQSPESGWTVHSLVMQALGETGDRASLINQALERNSTHSGKQ